MKTKEQIVDIFIAKNRENEIIELYIGEDRNAKKSYMNKLNEYTKPYNALNLSNKEELEKIIDFGISNKRSRLLRMVSRFDISQPRIEEKIFRYGCENNQPRILDELLHMNDIKYAITPELFDLFLINIAKYFKTNPNWGRIFMLVFFDYKGNNKFSEKQIKLLCNIAVKTGFIFILKALLDYKIIPVTMKDFYKDTLAIYKSLYYKFQKSDIDDVEYFFNKEYKAISSFEEEELESHFASLNYKGKVFKTGVPVTFNFIRNTESSEKFYKKDSQEFQQHLNPAGRFMTFDDRVDNVLLPKWETGTVTFKNPLVINFGEKFDNNSWKAVLNRIYKATGKALTSKLMKDGYDGIVTIKDNELSEIVDFTVLK